MKEIEWHTEMPTKSGYYITTREQHGTKKRYIAWNLWKGEDWPGNKVIGWQYQCLDNSKVVAWASEKDVEPFKDETIWKSKNRF